MKEISYKIFDGSVDKIRTIKSALKQGTLVKYRKDAVGFDGYGRVVGQSDSPLPPLGRGYIIEHDFKKSDPLMDESWLTKEYTHIVLFEAWFEVVKEY